MCSSLKSFLASDVISLGADSATLTLFDVVLANHFHRASRACYIGVMTFMLMRCASACSVCTKSPVQPLIDSFGGPQAFRDAHASDPPPHLHAGRQRRAMVYKRHVQRQIQRCQGWQVQRHVCRQHDPGHTISTQLESIHGGGSLSARECASSPTVWCL